MKIPVVTTFHKKGDFTWPNPYWNCEAQGRKFVERLSRFFPDVEFVMELAQTKEDAEALLERYDDAVGFVVYLASMWQPVIPTLAEAGSRLVLVDELYAGSGGLLIHYAQARNHAHRVAAVASSNFNDVVRAVNVLVAIGRLSKSRMLVYTDKDHSDFAGLLKKTWGVDFVAGNSDDLNAAYAAADENEADAIAKRWKAQAQEVVEPSDEDILKGARLYLAMRAEMRRFDADAVSVDCLNYVYGGKLNAYPCLGFMELNNSGLVGVCEADVQSTLCFLVFKALAGKPGYVSDPVIDEASNQIIYAHCVATTKPFGPDTESCPYVIRSHAEDDKGASNQSFLPLGKITTTIQISVPHKVITLHTAKSVANVVSPLACRTKLACEANVGPILENWNARPGFGWHRVTVFGDYQKDIQYLAKIQGFELFREDA